MLICLVFKVKGTNVLEDFIFTHFYFLSNLQLASTGTRNNKKHFPVIDGRHPCVNYRYTHTPTHDYQES